MRQQQRRSNQRDIPAAYEQWSIAEWEEVTKILSSEGSDRERARKLVLMFIDFHTHRRRFAHFIADNGDVNSTGWRNCAPSGRPHRRREQDIVYQYATERTFDAIAQGELSDLGLNRKLVIEAMVETTIAALS